MKLLILNDELTISQVYSRLWTVNQSEDLSLRSLTVTQHTTILVECLNRELSNSSLSNTTLISSYSSCISLSYLYAIVFNNVLNSTLNSVPTECSSLVNLCRSSSQTCHRNSLLNLVDNLTILSNT